jgi:hypothetical protein
MQTAPSCLEEQKRNLPKRPNYASFSPSSFIVKNLDPIFIWDTTKAVCKQLCEEAKTDYTIEVQSTNEENFKIKLALYSVSESTYSLFEVSIFATDNAGEYMIETHRYSGDTLLFYQMYNDFLKLMNDNGLVRIEQEEFQKKRLFLSRINPKPTTYELSDGDITSFCNMLYSEYTDVFENVMPALVEHMYKHGAECSCFVKDRVIETLVAQMNSSSFEVARLAVTALVYLSRSTEACQMLEQFKKSLEEYVQSPHHHTKIKSKVDALLVNMKKNCM